MAEAIMSVEYGRVLVGLKSPADGVLGTYQSSELLEGGLGPAGALALDGIDQDAVGSEEIVVRQGRRLV